MGRGQPAAAGVRVSTLSRTSTTLVGRYMTKRLRRGISSLMDAPHLGTRTRMGATNLVPNGIFGTVVQNWYRSVVSGDVPYSEQKNVYKEYINVPFDAHPGAI